MNVTVKNNSSDSLTIKVLVGVYNDNDTLKTAKLQTVTLDSKAEQTISFVGITSDKSVSIFAWDKDMTPLTNVLQYNTKIHLSNGRCSFSFVFQSKP